MSTDNIEDANPSPELAQLLGCAVPIPQGHSFLSTQKDPSAPDEEPFLVKGNLVEEMKKVPDIDLKNAVKVPGSTLKPKITPNFNGDITHAELSKDGKSIASYDPEEQQKIQEALTENSKMIEAALNDKKCMIGFLYNLIRKFNGYKYASVCRFNGIHEDTMQQSLIAQRLCVSYLYPKLQGITMESIQAGNHGPGQADFIREFVDPNYKDPEYVNVEPVEGQTDGVALRKIKDPKWIPADPNMKNVIVMIHQDTPPMTQEGLYDQVGKTRIHTVLILEEPKSFQPMLVGRRGDLIVGDPFLPSREKLGAILDVLKKEQRI